MRIQAVKEWDELGAKSGSPHVQVVEARTNGFRSRDVVVQIVKAWDEFGVESGSHSGEYAVKAVLYYPQ
jgi:hypothetical protein